MPKRRNSIAAWGSPALTCAAKRPMRESLAKRKFSLSQTTLPCRPVGLIGAAHWMRAAARHDNARYILQLYVTGTTRNSERAIVNMRKICEDHLQGRYNLEIVAITRHPMLAEAEQIIAAPTLIKKLPLPLRRFIGDMSQTERILLGLDPRKTTERASSGATR